MKSEIVYRSRLAIGILCVLGGAKNFLFSQTTDPSTQPSLADVASKVQYVVSYIAPTVANPVAEVEVTVFAPVSDEIMDFILRKELRKQVDKEAPTTNVLGFGFIHKRGDDPNLDGNSGDTQIYDLPTKTFMSMDEFDKTRAGDPSEKN